MPPKKKKVSGKKGSKKKGKRVSKKQSASGSAQLVTEAGLKSREFLRLQVGDLKDQVARLRESNASLKGDRDALFDIGTASTEQLQTEVEYYRRENLRHIDELEDEKRKWIEGTANLRREILEAKDQIEIERTEAQAREGELKAEIVALNQKLAGLEEFRDQEHAIRRQLSDVQGQLAQCEALYDAEKAALERKLVEQQGKMAAAIDEKVAEVANAFQQEADARLDDRAAGALQDNVKMERKLREMNTQVKGVVDANEKLKQKVAELKIELQIADDAQKSLASGVRKSKKVTETLRDRLQGETSKISELTTELKEAKESHKRHAAEQQRLIDAMQASLDATERTRKVEAHRLEDLSHMTTVTGLIEWVIADLERRFLAKQHTLDDPHEQHAAALYHKEQMQCLDLVLHAAPKIVKKLVKAVPAQEIRRTMPASVASVGVQAGGPQFSTKSSTFGQRAPPVKDRAPLYTVDARKPTGSMRSENHTHRTSIGHAPKAPAQRRRTQTGTQFGLDVFSLAAAVHTPQRLASTK